MDGYVEELRKQSIGGVIKYIKLGNLTDALIELPDINTQKEIVKVLKRSKTIIKKYQQELQSLDDLIKARFVEMFGDPISNSNNYPLSSFGELFELNAGGTPSKNETGYWENGTISWIGSNMCQNKVLSDNDGKYITQEGLEHSSAKWYNKGFVLVALVGATIGKCALLNFDTTTNQNIAGINVPSNKNFEPFFVFFTLQSLYSLFLNIGEGKFKMAN
jgi:type I restriction enzyme S subunit